MNALHTPHPAPPCAVGVAPPAGSALTVVQRRLTKRAIRRLAEAAVFLAGGLCEVCGIGNAEVIFGNTWDGRSCYMEWLIKSAVWRDGETGAQVQDAVEYNGFPPTRAEVSAYYVPAMNAVVVRCSRHLSPSGRRCP
jgi:hypothetical protein